MEGLSYEEFSKVNPGINWTPDQYASFLKEHEQSHNVYEEFMEEYEKLHELCPKCGASIHSSTLAGYIFDSNHPENYKDENRCICSGCGNTHTAHERISWEQAVELGFFKS